MNDGFISLFIDSKRRSNAATETNKNQLRFSQHLHNIFTDVVPGDARPSALHVPPPSPPMSVVLTHQHTSSVVTLTSECLCYLNVTLRSDCWTVHTVDLERRAAPSSFLFRRTEDGL